MGTKPDTSDTDIDWENRVLCSDGNCIGVIGPDGRCKECGLLYEGELPYPTASADPPETPAAEPVPAPPEQTVSDPDEGEAEATSEDEWAQRKLCVDGNCIGVIGPDGKCKECGRPFES